MNQIRHFGAAILIVSASIVLPGGLSAYETDWQDPKLGEAKNDKDETIPNSTFKVDGEIWNAYEFLDHSQNGELDPTGPDQEKTGFKVGRVYANISGKAKAGDWKGIGFRITPDIRPIAQEADGCGTDNICTKDNGYMLFMKFAFIDLPLPIANTLIRVGQQPTPQTDGQAGHSPTGIWAHRYLDNAGKPTWEDVGLIGSTDRGVSLLHSADYYGVHLSLYNGEGFRKTNAQTTSTSKAFDNTATSPVTAAQTMTNLANGTTDSHALDTGGSIYVRPTGKNKEFQWDVTFPFRFWNSTGIDSSEVERTTIDSTLTTYNYFRGDTRAKRDYAYGAETDVIIKLEGFSATIGGGTAVKVDRRGSAVRIDNTTAAGINPADIATIGARWKVETDTRGVANYGYIHLKFGSFGVVTRYTTGTGQGATLNGQMGTTATKGWMERVLSAHLAKGSGLTYSDLRNADMGASRFTNAVFGITYFLNDRFKVTGGISRLTGTDGAGYALKQNAAERIACQATTAGGTCTGNLSTMLASNAAVKGALGYSAAETMNLNDYIGKRRVDQEVFIRSTYVY